MFTTESQLLMTKKKKPFENSEGKEENAGNQHFSSFPIMFSIISMTIIAILVSFNLLPANASNFDWYKILLFGKELNLGNI